jgi:hypothetical protein
MNEQKNKAAIVFFVLFLFFVVFGKGGFNNVVGNV